MASDLMQKIAHKFNCEYCNYITSNKYDYSKHIMTLKHNSNVQKTRLAINGNLKNASIVAAYNCDICNFYSKNKTNYDKHLLSEKHKKNCTLVNEGEPTKNKNICSHCNKEYLNYNALWKHKKKCNSNSIDLSNDISTTTFTPELFMSIVKENKEIQNVLIEQNKELQNKLLEQNAEHHKQIIELANKQVSNITNNTNNTTNNSQFNLNFFLNETCKDAMNITDFVNSLQVQIADLEKTGKLGYVEGISGILMRGLNALDYTMRPIHCTDLKRETVYVKDENSWEKDDDEKAKLKLAIQRVARKNLRTLPRWQEENPDFKILDTKENDSYIKIALNSLGGQTDEQHEKYVEKIMRNVLKEVVIEKK